MKATVDSGGRVLLPKSLRTALGLTPGSTVDISRYGDGLRLVAGGRTARLVRDEAGSLVADASTPVTDDIVFALVDTDRR